MARAHCYAMKGSCARPSGSVYEQDAEYHQHFVYGLKLAGFLVILQRVPIRLRHALDMRSDDPVALNRFSACS